MIKELTIEEILEAPKKANSKDGASDLYQLSHKRRKLYQKRPDLWLTERFGEPLTDLVWTIWDVDAYKNHTWDGTKNPFYEVFKALANGQSVGLESGTGTGKSHLLARVMFWYLDCFEDSLVVSTAPKQSQLKQVLWAEVSKAFPKFKKIRPNAALYSLKVAVDDQSDDMGGYMAIGAVAGVKAGEESATRLQGFHRKRMLFLIDEMAGVPMAILNAIKQTIANPKKNLILGVGNPDNQNDALHKHCTSPDVRHIISSSFDHINVVRQNAGRGTVIDGAITKESIELRIKEYGEKSNIIQSRIRGRSTEQTSNALIRKEWLEQCYQSHHPDTQNSFNAVGVDVSNSDSGDKSAVAYGKGNTLTELYTFQARANYLAYNLIYEKNELLVKGLCPPDHIYNIPTVQSYGILASGIGVDAVGIGVSTVHTLHAEYWRGICSLQGKPFDAAIQKDYEGRNLYSYVSLRAQMYFLFAHDLMNNKLNICIQDYAMWGELFKQATNIKYVTSSSSITVEKKEDFKKRLGYSPDALDAVVYWNFVRRFGYQYANDY